MYICISLIDTIFKRIFTHTASEYETQSVLSLKEIYHQCKVLAARLNGLLNETTLEEDSVEMRTYWNRSITVVFNPNTGRVEWRKWNDGIHSIFNPVAGTDEGQQAFKTGMHGVYNPSIGTIEWKISFQSAVGSVYNPSTR